MAKGRRRGVEQLDSNDNDDNDGSDDDDGSQIRELNLLVPNLSLSTGCAPGFLPGALPPALAQSLSQQILSLLHTSCLVRTSDLQVWYQPPDFSAIGREETDCDEMDTRGDLGQRPECPQPEIKAFWVLYIDVLIISLAGNPFDVAWAAVLAALRDTKLPRAWWDADSGMVLCSDEPSEARKLTLRGMPIASSYCVFEADPAVTWRAVIVPAADEPRDSQEDQKQNKQRWILADPDGYEENLCQERISLVVDQEPGGKTRILRMEKNGGLSVGREGLKMLVDASGQRWRQLKSILEGLG
jgi:exosome complex component RRP43